MFCRGIEHEVLYGETDCDGHDVIIGAGGVLRHVQLKVTILAGARNDISVDMRLAGKPAGCVVWMVFDPASRDFTSIRSSGKPPGTALPDPGDKTARHSRANAQGIKAIREGHCLLQVGRLDRLHDIAHLADKPFGWAHRSAGEPALATATRRRDRPTLP